MEPDGRPGARRRAPVLDAELMGEVDELRHFRRQLWERHHQEARRLRELLPRIIAAGYGHRAAAALLGISYTTVQIILHGKRRRVKGAPADGNGLALDEKPGGY